MPLLISTKWQDFPYSLTMPGNEGLANSLEGNHLRSTLLQLYPSEDDPRDPYLR